MELCLRTSRHALQTRAPSVAVTRLLCATQLRVDYPPLLGQNLRPPQRVVRDRNLGCAQAE